MRFTLPFNLCKTRSRELTPVRTAAELKATTGLVGGATAGAGTDTGGDIDTVFCSTSDSAAAAKTDLLPVITGSTGAATPKERFGAEEE